SAKAAEALLAKRDSLPAVLFPQVLRSAVRLWPADKVYSEFSPLLEARKGAGKEKREMLERFIHGAYARIDIFSASPEDLDGERVPDKLTWDPRWLDAAIKADSRPIVCWLARPDHKPSLDYLLKPDGVKEPYYACLTVQALARCQYPKVTDFFLEQVTKKAKSAKYYDYELQTLLRSASHLPAADLPQLDAFAAKLDEKFVDHFLEAIAPLRSQPLSDRSDIPDR
ncbi:MAG TPA: hypothetical protein VF988_04040, partial [Verrucomicrobiae bacterium]